MGSKLQTEELQSFIACQNHAHKTNTFIQIVRFIFPIHGSFWFSVLLLSSPTVLSLYCEILVGKLAWPDPIN